MISRFAFPPSSRPSRFARPILQPVALHRFINIKDYYSIQPFWHQKPF